jgi:hypothetical protein
MPSYLVESYVADNVVDDQRARARLTGEQAG